MLTAFDRLTHEMGGYRDLAVAVARGRLPLSPQLANDLSSDLASDLVSELAADLVADLIPEIRLRPESQNREYNPLGN